MVTRFGEHRDVQKPTAVTKPLIRYNHDISFDNMSIIASSNDLESYIKESILVKKFSPRINKNDKNVISWPL